ncbi:MAG TPA: TPM domain-containing protein [Myxococcota bacterium]|nr:TPM domain-containing protein [Myxococcota bacterium]
MDWMRLVRHLATSARAVRRRFPDAALSAIEAAIAAAEARHEPEIRFAVEGALHPRAILRGVAPRDRAIAVFGELRVWDTEHNTGVLIYLLLADRDVEIVADRGVAAVVSPSEWKAICRDMEAHLREDRYEEGALAGIRAASDLLARHFPAGGPHRHEQPDRPVVL